MSYWHLILSASLKSRQDNLKLSYRDLNSRLSYWCVYKSLLDNQARQFTLSCPKLHLLQLVYIYIYTRSVSVFKFRHENLLFYGSSSSCLLVSIKSLDLSRNSADFSQKLNPFLVVISLGFWLFSKLGLDWLSACAINTVVFADLLVFEFRVLGFWIWGFLH